MERLGGGVFVDNIKIFAKAGDGGNGAASFRREKFVPRGGPDGGDGGNGGNVVLQVDPHTDNLRQFFYKPKHHAPSGVHGARHKKTGKTGKDLILKVPPGTLVYRDKQEDEIELAEIDSEEIARAADEGREFVIVDGGDNEEEPVESEVVETERELVADLTEIGEKFVLCSGGIGGKGNVHFKSPTNQAPVDFTTGTEGEEGTFYLELRRIADAGLVGLPNAGKSTLLTKLSAARPKVAAYPFTTLQPMVGVLDFEGFSRATVADIPGLIEGAHENIGLGHDFLRHIMRCRLLLFVVDMAGSEGRDPTEDLATLRTEISLYDEGLAKQEWLVLANKMDLEASEENLKVFRNRFPKVEIIPISAMEELGLDALRARLRELIGHRPK